MMSVQNWFCFEVKKQFVFLKPYLHVCDHSWDQILKLSYLARLAQFDPSCGHRLGDMALEKMIMVTETVVDTFFTIMIIKEGPLCVSFAGGTTPSLVGYPSNVGTSGGTTQFS